MKNLTKGIRDQVLLQVYNQIWKPDYNNSRIQVWEHVCKHVYNRVRLSVYYEIWLYLDNQLKGKLI